MYYILKTRDFLNSSKSQYIDENLLQWCCNMCYNNCAFSTFSYIVNESNSYNSIVKTNTGNCVSLSMYLQIVLSHHNIKSFLIPATIPKIYMRPKLLNITHVALAIPKNKTEIYILDPAFYLLSPIKLNIETTKSNENYMTNVYNDIVHKFIYKTIKSENKIEYNEYQEIPNNTNICECYNVNDVMDKWYYYLLEIINPDRAISTAYINIVEEPFITTTRVRNNSICYIELYLKLIKDNILKINKGLDTFYYGSYNDIPREKKDIINNILLRYHINFNDMIEKTLLGLKKKKE